MLQRPLSHAVRTSRQPLPGDLHNSVGKDCRRLVLKSVHPFLGRNLGCAGRFSSMLVLSLYAGGVVFAVWGVSSVRSLA